MALKCVLLQCYVAGFVVMSLLAIATRNWQWLTLSFCILQLIPLALMIFISESPKWLIERNRLSRALGVLHRFCRINRHSQMELNQLIEEKHLEEDGLQEINLPKKTYTYFHLFRNREAIKRSALACQSWFSISCVYYGLVFYSGDLPGDPAINLLVFSVFRTFLGLLMPLADRKVIKHYLTLTTVKSRI